MKDLSQFKYNIQFIQETAITDNAGGRSVSATTYYSTYSRMESKQENFQIEGSQRTFHNSYTFTIRKRPDKTITYSHYIMYNNEKYSIHSILNYSENECEYLKIKTYKKN
jgi:hypothetical protein